MVRVGFSRAWVRPGVARGREMCVALEERRLYVVRARDAGVGSALFGAGRVRGAWEERIRA